jgi:hypothetical protein
MAGINSRAKGARAEREAAKIWSDVMGCSARRGQQFSGGKDSPDVVHSVPGIHLEVKRVERGNPYDWMGQAIVDAGDGQVPVVLHRRNNKPWLLIVRLEDVPKFMEAAAGPSHEAVAGGAVPPHVSGEGVPPADDQDGRAAWLFHHG